jgi:hypothetical protein
MRAPTEDRLVMPVLRMLRDCLCDALGGSANLCGCLIIPGTLDGYIDVGECDSATAWVRLVEGPFPSTQLPTSEVGAPGSFMAAQIELGVARSITSIDEDGSAPTQEQQEADTEALMLDMALIKYAITCCFGEIDDPNRDYVLGSYTPLPGMGGVGGGAWSVFVRLN